MMLTLVIIVCAFISGAFFARLVITRPPKPPKPPQAICTCGHGKGHHIDGKGACQGEEKREVRWWTDAWGSTYPNKWDWFPCRCLSYTGPEPLPVFFSPEISQ